MLPEFFEGVESGHVNNCTVCGNLIFHTFSVMVKSDEAKYDEDESIPCPNCKAEQMPNGFPTLAHRFTCPDCSTFNQIVSEPTNIVRDNENQTVVCDFSPCEMICEGCYAGFKCVGLMCNNKMSLRLIRSQQLN